MKLWPLSGRQAIPRVFGAPGSWVNTLAFSKRGHLLACGLDKGEIELRTIPGGELLRRWLAHPNTDVMSVAFAGNDEALLSCGKDGLLRIWSTPDCELRLALPLDAGELRSLAVSPNGQMVAVASERNINLLSFSTKPLAVRAIARRQAHTATIADIAFLSDSGIASSSYDRTVVTYNVPTLEPLKNYTGHGDLVRQVKWIAQSARLASASDDKTVRLWSVNNDQDRNELRGHEGGVASLAGTPDGTRMFSGDSDGVIISWNLAKRARDGFLFDPAANPKSTTGITYRATDRVTGHQLTFTLPCGSPIPAGATCVCNCVPGTYIPPPPPRESRRTTSTPSSPSTIRIPGGTIRKPCTAQPVPPGYECTCNCIPGRY
ncbi:MAG: hypothetical protein IT168_21650 [Bryobacterales bacterium]|nr:hypothetical protein [Bryobacterales bacterium]